MSDVAVIGAAGGIGKFLAAELGTIPFVRNDDVSKLESVRTIIFCAAKAHFETPASMLYSSIEDNLLLLERISRLPHERFVYFSTVDLYPQDGKVHREDEDLQIENTRGGYPAFKLMGEAIVRERCNMPLILRPTSLFGDGMRPNNISRLISGHTDDPTLREDASFNCVTYSMIATFIETAIAQDVTGTFNCAATGQVTLGDVAKLAAYGGGFGPHDYQVPIVSNEKVCKVAPVFERTSLDIVKRMLVAARQ